MKNYKHREIIEKIISKPPALIPALITTLSWKLKAKRNMGVMTAIKMRRSIRHYKDTPVEEEKLEKVLEAGRLAPSAGNLQEWKFVVVRDKTTREKLATAANNQKFVREAPVVIVACATVTDYIMECGQLAYPIDVAIAVDHMTLDAVEEGLGTCWVGSFDDEEAKKILGIPNNIRVVTLLTGYPEYVPSPRMRKKMEEIVIYEKWT